MFKAACPICGHHTIGLFTKVCSVCEYNLDEDNAKEAEEKVRRNKLRQYPHTGKLPNDDTD